MSKYQPLWRYVQTAEDEQITLTFAQIADILGFPIDHSFLQFKKELAAFGARVGKISLKEQTVLFIKQPPPS